MRIWAVAAPGGAGAGSLDLLFGLATARGGYEIGFGFAKRPQRCCLESPAAGGLRADADRSVTCSQCYALSHQTEDENADLGCSWSNKGLEGLADFFVPVSFR